MRLTLNWSLIEILSHYQGRHKRSHEIAQRMHQVIFQRLWMCQINNRLKTMGGYIVWTQCPARGFSCHLFFCSAGVLPSRATSALRLAVNIIFVVHWASLTSGSTSMSSTDSLRVVTCSFNSYTFERMNEIASVSAGVCALMCSPHWDLPCLYGRKYPQICWGNQTLPSLACQLHWHVNLVSVSQLH